MCFTPNFEEGDEDYLDRYSLFHSASEKSAAKGYSKMQPRKQRPHRVTGVQENTVQILQDGLEDTISINRTTLARDSRTYWYGRNGKEEGSTQEEPFSEKASIEAHQNADDLYVVEKTV